MIYAFDDLKNKYNVDRGKDFIKKICECSKDHAMKKIKF